MASDPALASHLAEAPVDYLYMSDVNFFGPASNALLVFGAMLLGYALLQKRGSRMQPPNSQDHGVINLDDDSDHGVIKLDEDSDEGPWIEVRGHKWEGRFEFRESDQFAESGTARVYRGRDTAHRPVCIKIAAKGGQLVRAAQAKNALCPCTASPRATL